MVGVLSEKKVCNGQAFIFPRNQQSGRKKVKEISIILLSLFITWAVLMR